jgi:hypothetical protein
MSSQNSLGFRELDAEIWFAKRLVQILTPVFVGTTDRDTRRERFRKAIIAGGLDNVVCGKRSDGKTETFAEAFERLYGEPLEPKRKKAG